MLDALVAAVVVALLVALALAVLYAVTVVPFLLACDRAERRGCSTGRWAGWSLLAVLTALVLTAAAVAADVPVLLAVPPLAVGFLPALVVGRGPDRLAGRAGRHESPV